jgi:hypothetical protein
MIQKLQSFKRGHRASFGLVPGLSGITHREHQFLFPVLLPVSVPVSPGAS